MQTNVIREVIQKAKTMAQGPEDLVLSERFEEYLDLLDIQNTLTNPKEQKEFMPRLKASFASLQEAVARACLSYGVSFEELMEHAEHMVLIPEEKIQSRQKKKR